MADALRRSSAGSITAVMPYYGYARQDRKVAPRTPITAKLTADLIQTSGVNRVVSVDLHAGQIQGFFNIPFDHLFSMPVFLEYYLKKNFDSSAVFVSPDAGGVERTRAYSKRLDASLAIVDKRRERANESEVMNLAPAVRSSGPRTASSSTTSSTPRGRSAARRGCSPRRGRCKVVACASHGVLSGPAVRAHLGVAPRRGRGDRFDPAVARGPGLPQDPAAFDRAAPRRGHKAHPQLRQRQQPVCVIRGFRYERRSSHDFRQHALPESPGSGPPPARAKLAAFASRGSSPPWRIRARVCVDRDRRRPQGGFAAILKSDHG